MIRKRVGTAVEFEVSTALLFSSSYEFGFSQAPGVKGVTKVVMTLTVFQRFCIVLICIQGP